MEMTQEWRNQFNKKCAEFLGWESAFAHEEDRYGYIQTVDGFNTPFYNYGDPQLVEMNSDINIHSIFQLKFHSDWNWIMEVVEKISSLREGDKPEGVCGKVFYFQHIMFHEIIGKRDNLIQKIDQFIDWYNKQKES